jgi:hypothetical protein
MDLDEMTMSYIETALWSSHCNGQSPHDECPGEDCDRGLDDLGYTDDDLAPGQLIEIKNQVFDFVQRCESEGDLLQGMDPGQAGHDFWLTRNGHGAGFWDRGLGERGDLLTKWAQSFGDADLYIGDDGLVYHNA